MPTTYRVESLSDFADGYLGYAEGQPLANAGPSCRAVAAQTEATEVDSLLSTMFWQVYIRSPAFPRLLGEAGLGPTNAHQLDEPHTGRQLGVLPHPAESSYLPRHDLLVLDDGFDGEPLGLDVSATQDELHEGWSELKRVVTQPDVTRAASTLLHMEHPDIAWEVYRRQLYGVDAEADPSAELIEQPHGRFRVLVAEMPELHSTSVPEPAWRVAPPATDGAFATAGILARNSDGVLGVTIPHHVMVDEVSTPVPVGTRVDVAGLVGTVVSDSIETDSCFVALPTVDEPQIGLVSATVGPGGLAVRIARIESETFASPTGVKTGKTPGQYERSTFIGALSGRNETRVLTWDPDVTFVSPGSRTKVFTELKTGGGDSGAALVSVDDGRLLGFAHQVTPLDAVPPMSTWIWAECIMLAHNLTIQGIERHAAVA